MISGLFGSRARRSPSGETAKVPDGIRVFAIGDIHGRADLLDLVHERIEADLRARKPEKAVAVYLGDYVDRGADSYGVLERLSREAPAGVRRIFLKGNHEEMLELFLGDPDVGNRWRQLGGTETLFSYGVDVNAALARGGMAGLAQDFAKKVPPAHREFLAALELYTVLGDYFFCHAGVRPGVPLERQRAADLLWIRDEFLSSGASFGKVIVHGHSPVEMPDFRSNRINIDTGAYATNRLTCLVLEGSGRRILPAESIGSPQPGRG